MVTKIILLLADWRMNPQTLFLMLGDEENLHLPTLLLPDPGVKYLPHVHTFLQSVFGLTLRPMPYLLWTEQRGDTATAILGIDASFLRLSLQDDAGFARKEWINEDEALSSLSGIGHEAFTLFHDILESRKKSIRSMERENFEWK